MKSGPLGGPLKAVLTGELWVGEFHGPGHVLIQTRAPAQLRGWLLPSGWTCPVMYEVGRPARYVTASAGAAWAAARCTARARLGCAALTCGAAAIAITTSTPPCASAGSCSPRCAGRIRLAPRPRRQSFIRARQAAVGARSEREVRSAVRVRARSPPRTAWCSVTVRATATCVFTRTGRRRRHRGQDRPWPGAARTRPSGGRPRVLQKNPVRQVEGQAAGCLANWAAAPSWRSSASPA